MSHMEFLLPYMTNAERDTNVTPHPDISTSFEETANTDVSRDSADTITAPKKRKTDEIIHNDEDLLNFLKDMDDNLAKRTAQRDELRKEVLTSSDPLKAFFDSMYHSTKQMPEYYQRTIKRKLFQLVMDAEDNIANTNYSYTGYYSNDYSYNSRPSTSQTNFSTGHGSASPEPSGSGVQQIGIGEHTTRTSTRSQNEEIQDSMSAAEITPSDGALP
ncbi:hypothetical protein HF086_001073 [Spodoptera exigua]|uniref:BESS domain-containing protein n=1 Tax=Spodoptera exigua TaxID=7107 RepID=A0A922M6K4_SPOEX|nr:hypothetical protein HF086_001073 [Spodoptera exigua]